MIKNKLPTNKEFVEKLTQSINDFLERWPSG